MAWELGVGRGPVGTGSRRRSAHGRGRRRSRGNASLPSILAELPAAPRSAWVTGVSALRAGGSGGVLGKKARWGCVERKGGARRRGPGEWRSPGQGRGAGENVHVKMVGGEDARR